ncbi:MAG: bile acid:sodium symporter family protein [Bacteroidales bacterium]|nr:bile acid:sodium symporter family protein [Bacteroidales bacterium]
MHESLLQLDKIRLNFSTEGLLVLNLTLAFIMFGVALGIKFEHFKELWNNKRYPILGFISQFFVLPAVTVLVIILLNRFITPTIALGMILVASCPGGNISNFISALAKGNAALSVTLTAIATISAIVMTPFNFLFWGGVYTRFLSRFDTEGLLRPLEISPYHVFQTVFILLGIPLILGMLFNHYFPKATEKINKPIKILSILCFTAIVLLAFKKNYDYFLLYIKYIFFIVLVHNAVGFTSGYLFSGIIKSTETIRRTIAIETGIQNSGLALVLLFNPKIFPTDMAIGGMAFIAAWWGIWHILAGLSLAGFWSWRRPRG